MGDDKESFQDFVRVDKINPDALVPEMTPDVESFDDVPKNQTAIDSTPVISHIVPPQAKKKSVAPLNNKQKRAIESGKHKIEARLDLHGETRKDAHSQVIAFINTAKINQHRMLLIVTGKGKGILRGDLPQWLQQFRADILHHCFAASKHGGDGAYYVYLRRSKT